MIRLIKIVWISIFLLLSIPQVYARTVLDHAALTLELDHAASPVHIADVPLPYHWDRLNGAVDGHAHFSFTFTSDNIETPQAIYVSRIGNTFELTLNGVSIGKVGTPDNKYEDFSKQPYFFHIPNGVLHKLNTLDVTINVQGGRNGGLAPLVLGAEDEVQAAYLSRFRWTVTGTLVVVVISSVLGSLSLILWFRQRDNLYLLYASSELLWIVYLCDTFFDYSPLPWPWWGVVYFSAYAMSGVLMFKFALQAMDLHKGFLNAASDWQLLLTLPIILAGLFGHLPWLEQVWRLVTHALIFCIIVTVVWHGIFSRKLEKRILAMSLLVIVAGGLRDSFVLDILPYTKIFSAFHDQFGALVWARYTWCLFGISLAWLIAERMRKSTQEIAGMNQSLSHRLAQREAELNATFSRQIHVDRHQAIIEERQRLTRDMHDGLGSQLLVALHLSQDLGATRDALTRQLRETMDHLKLTVDAMQDTEGDIASLLGALRYRLGPRLEAAGVQLVWSVDHLPEITTWTLQQSRDLQMILFEAFSNLITHAGATHASFCATPHADLHCIAIVLTDNGCGFNHDASIERHGHGIINMHARAARINAVLQIDSTIAGTTTSLTIQLGHVHGGLIKPDNHVAD